MENIKKYQFCPYIFLIWKDGGGIGKNFKTYLKENYYVTENEFVLPLISDELYGTLGDSPNSVVHYFHNQQRILRIDGKYDDIPVSPLAYDFIKIDRKDKLILSDSSYFHSNQVDYFAINDSLSIELFDGHKDRVRLTNITNGKVLKVFDLDQIDYKNLYKQFFNFSNISIEAINESDDFLNHIKRTPLRIDKVYVKGINEIYLIGNATVEHRTDKKRYIPGEYKSETIVVNPGDFVTDGFDIVIKTDTSFRALDYVLIDQSSNLDYTNNHFVDPFSGFYIKDKQYYSFAYNYNPYKDKTYNQFFKRNKKTQFIHQFRREGNFLIFEEKMKSECAHAFDSFYSSLDALHFFGTKTNTWVMFDLFPEIYNLSSIKPTQSIVPKEKELHYTIPKSGYDDVEPNYPFHAYQPGYGLNKSLLFILYRKENEFYVNVYDTRMHLVQQLNMSEEIWLVDQMSSIYFYSNMVAFTDNYLNTFYCDSEGCYNYRYSITYNPVNEECIYLKDKFIP